MGYYMRFVVADDKNISLIIINSGLKEKDAAYSVEFDDDADDAGDLTYNGDIYGAFEINRPGDGLVQPPFITPMRWRVFCCSQSLI